MDPYNIAQEVLMLRLIGVHNSTTSGHFKPNAGSGKIVRLVSHTGIIYLVVIIPWGYDRAN